MELDGSGGDGGICGVPDAGAVVEGIEAAVDLLPGPGGVPPRRIAVWDILVVMLLRGEGDELTIVGRGVAGGDAGQAVGEGDAAVSVGLTYGDGQRGCGVRGEGELA